MITLRLLMNMILRLILHKDCMFDLLKHRGSGIECKLMMNCMIDSSKDKLRILHLSLKINSFVFRMMCMLLSRCNFRIGKGRVDNCLLIHCCRESNYEPKERE